MLVLLLERGSPVDVRSVEGATPLMNAAQARSVEKVAFLLDRGADPDATDQRGFTALHRAAEMGEREIVQLLAEGKSNKEVATMLTISVKTAETHRARIMAKLNLRSIGDLVRYAVRNGIVEP